MLLLVYTPQRDDCVIGVITQRFAEEYEVDINSSYTGRLNVVAFEGATKRNHPYLKPGDLVYCRVLQTFPGMQADLTCIVSGGPRSEWVNGSSLFGQLSAGYVFKVSCTQARKLLEPTCDILQTIGSQIPYECAIGVNGFVHVQQNDHN
ncbi:hypothetical protein JH06_5109 [Blastocystis sp. subtype 4]|uniref:hypothetical protein n=1 Tax=Blastocystis sp. subtype 4 TaxID=944170 RepID=UPI0007115172|nr:hypothetical protein JH06_5109 [Blastocystis sp. subtype 4]KNB41498.1 hypothetical protein JH06_5109 [Blastocystis sp. subtype 4]|eukprot:XP_014524941.1 hypothetical protein JH06_5109 [Blastocystis sp. subtype 4]